MPRNGSGTFSLPQAPFVTGTTISSTAVNSDFSDIAAALTQSISKDGQTTYTGNQPMAGNKLTGLGAGTAATDSVNMSQLVSGAANYALASGTDTITITPSPGITAYAIGQRFVIKIANTNTGAVTLNVNSVGAGAVTWPNGTALSAGDLPANAMIEVDVQATTPVFHLQTGANFAATQAVGNSSTRIATTAFVANALVSTLGSAGLRSYLAGLTLSAAGGTGTFGIAVGVAVDSTNVLAMVLGSAYTKTTSAWAVGTGNGAIDTGAIANTTWYHVYLIQRPDTGVVDVIFSTSASSPTLPANYTYYRRIGSMKTNGSAQWASFIQRGDDFYIAEVNDFQPTTTSAMTLRALSVPSGVVVQPKMRTLSIGGSANGTVLRVAPASNSALYRTVVYNDIGSGINSNNQGSAFEGPPTDTSAQIYMAVTALQASGSLQVYTAGWADRRGRDD